MNDRELEGVPAVAYYDGWGASMMEVDGPWSPALTEAWLERGAGVGLMYRANDGSNLDFLPDLRGLRLLSVSGNPNDDSAIGRCLSLERVVLQSTANNRIDWSRLTSLVRISLSARPGFDTMTVLESLRSLEYWDCPEVDFSVIGQISALESVSLKPSRRLRSLSGISGLTNLTYLEMGYAAGPLDLAELGKLNELKILDLRGFRRQLRLDGLDRCANLVELYLEDCGKFESLRPIASCQRLSKVYLGGDTTVVDGVMSVLAALPAIRYAEFPNRRHYDRRSDDFPKDA